MNIKGKSASASTDAVGTVRGKQSFARTMISVAQASFGVQNHANRQRDFSEGRFWPYVMAALIFTSLFVLILMLIVSVVV